MSYWDVLPLELQVYILRLRDNQALIEHRESLQSRALCDEIHDYGALRDKWGIGHIQIIPRFRYQRKVPFCNVKNCTCCEWLICHYLRIIGHYVDSNGEKQCVLLDHSYSSAMELCDAVKTMIDCSFF